MGEDRIRMCECGRHPLPSRRRQCDECNAEKVKAYNAKVSERRRLGLLPRTPSKPRWTDTGNEEIQLTPWVPRVKVQILSDAEQARVDEEARQRETAAHQRHMAQFGMVIRKGKPLAGTARKLSAKEIAEVANLYQPPQKAAPVLMGFLGEGRE